MSDRPRAETMGDDRMTDDTLRTAVLGTGLIGGSVLRRLHEQGADVVAWDPDPTTVALTRRLGVTAVDDPVTAVADRNLVVLAGPLSALHTMIDDIATAVSHEAIVTDVGSTKRDIADHALTTPLADRFIPGHPMAGTEQFGLAAADPNLFTDATWVLCPPRTVALRRVRRLVDILLTRMDAEVTLLPAEVHDTVAALASHIPHLLAGALAGGVAGTGGRDAVLNLAAGSFTDGTRVAGTPPRRTVDMLLANRRAIGEQLGVVTGFLTELSEELRAGDRDGLTRRFEAAQVVRHRLLATDRVVTRREFGDDPTAEFDFLLGTGVIGARLTGMTTVNRTTRYTVSSPRP